jgi:hypothetical protein
LPLFIAPFTGDDKWQPLSFDYFIHYGIIRAIQLMQKAHLIPILYPFPTFIKNDENNQEDWARDKTLRRITKWIEV